MVSAEIVSFISEIQRIPSDYDTRLVTRFACGYVFEIIREKDGYLVTHSEYADEGPTREYIVEKAKLRSTMDDLSPGLIITEIILYMNGEIHMEKIY